MKKASPYLVMILTGVCLAGRLGVAHPPAQNAPAARASGDVTEVKPGHLTVHSAKGDVQVELPDGVKLLRVPPGAKDLSRRSRLPRLTSPPATVPW